MTYLPFVLFLPFCVGGGLQQSSNDLNVIFRRDYVYQQEAEGWMKLHRSPATWFEARERCQNEGSVLASPLDETLQEVMLAVLGHKAHSIFTGISSTIANGEFFPGKDISETTVTNGEFFSVEGVSFDDIPTRWGSEEPRKHHCIAMYADGNLTDADCSQSRPYICFKKDSENIPKVNNCGTIDSDYVYEEKTEHCYKFHEIGETWEEAFSTCTKEGGYLAIINSATEAEVLKTIIEKHPLSVRKARETGIYGIGFHDWSGEHRSWMTVHGETLNDAGYEVWESSQPGNNSHVWNKGEYCGGIDLNGQLHDLGCGYTITYICEMDPIDNTYSIEGSQ